MGKALSIAPEKKGGKRKKKRSPRREFAILLLAAVALALLVRTFFIQPFRIPSRSMEDSLLVGDVLLVDKFTYGPRVPFTDWHLPALADPRPGDIVVFEYPLDPERVYVKRCVAAGGQVVEIRNKVVYVDGVRLPDPPFSKYVDPRILPAAENPRDNYGPERLPEGFVFVLGDNRDNSRDSRHWGALSQERIIGRARCIYWSCDPGYGAGMAGRTSRVRGLVDQVFSLPQRIRWQRLGDLVR